MLGNIMSYFPSIKESISYFFDYYIGIKLNLSNFSLDDNNNLYVKLTNINIDPSRINHEYLKDINIKLTKGLVEKIELRIGVNTFEIKISKLSVMLMPVVSINQKEKKEEIVIKKSIEKEEKKEDKENIENPENKKGLIRSFIENFLSKLKVSIEEIELITFNYEITNKNLSYANPVMSFNIYNINYDKGKIVENNNESYIRKNIWENKHFSIDSICLKFSKSFQSDSNKKDKDSTSVYGDGDDKKKNNFDKDNNDNIMLINSDKGIHFYTNTKNEIQGDLGDIQFVINLFQLELLKNFIDTYLLYLNCGDNTNNNNIKEEKNLKKENINNFNGNININGNNSSSSSVIAKSNNEIMNIKIKLNSFSIIILERNQNSTELKFYEFNKDKMHEHFCYFEDNFFIFILYNLNIQYDNKKKLVSLTTDEICLNYVEYMSKTKKEEEIELIARKGSEYSDCNESLVFKGNEMFHSIGESNMFDVKEYYCSYDYKYNKNQILLIKNINLGFNYSVKDKKKLNFDLNSFSVNFHPIFLFKLLKNLYDNSFLIKEVLFYNYEQIKEYNKKEKEKDNEETNSNIININKEKEEEKNIEKSEKLNLSFLSCEEEEDKDNEIKNKNIIKTKEKQEENKVFKSELLFEDDKPKEKINDTIKKLLKDLNIEIKIRTIEIKIYCFKCEESFYNIINPFFNEFYYDHIYIMDMKDDFRQKKLKISETSSSDYFNLIIKYLVFKNEKKNGDELMLKFHSIISSFTNNKLLEVLSDTYPIKYNLDENKISVDLKINLYFKVKLLPYMLSFANIWNYTLAIFDIFQQRMIYNYNKGKDELAKMNFEKNILDYFEQNKRKNNSVNDNNDIDNYLIEENGNKMNIEINIKTINIYFDIITQKIKCLTTISNIKLIYTMNNINQNIQFSIKKLESKEFKSSINDINLELKINKIKNNDAKSLKNSTTSKNKIKNINMKSYMIVPEQAMEIYIENIIRLKKRREQLNNKYNQPKHLIKTDLNISIKDIQLEPLESVLYINDIYNVIVKEEIINNNDNLKKQVLLKSTDYRTMSMYSKSSNDKNENNIIESIIEPKMPESKISIGGNKEPLFIINFNISSIKCIINDEQNERSTEINIREINLKTNHISCETIEFLIFYEPKDFSDKVKINLGSINDLSLKITEKINHNSSFNIIIDEIFFTFCQDSFLYLQNVLDNVSEIMSNCFVQAKKSNKIIVTKKNDKILNTYDIDESQDKQESELFGNNVAKSICLISSKNEFVLDVDEDYLDNLKNEKEEVNEIIDDEYKSTLRKNKLRNNDESDLCLTIKKINIGLYKGKDFESTLDIKTRSMKDEEKEKEKEKEEKEKKEKNNENKLIITDINMQLENLQKNLNVIEINDNINENLKIDEIQKKKDKKPKEIKRKESDSFEIIECNHYKKINGREKNDYLLLNITDVNLSILYEKKNSYEIEFTISDLEIKDNLRQSTFKRLLSAMQNVGINEEKIKIPFLSIFVDISNSQNELSTNNYTDFNITCEIGLASIQLMIHQNSLLFVLDFFIKDTDKQKLTSKDSNSSLQLYNDKQYHTNPSFVLDSQFSQIIIEDYGEEQNDLIEDKNFFYITNFLFREFEINITYESNDFGFRFQNICIPLIPDLKGYPFIFSRITYKGFVTLNQFTDYFINNFFGQLSKYNIFFDLLKSLSWTQPIFNIFGDFFDIFISPFQSYRKNQGFMQGLFKGLKKFFFNLLSKNVYAGEKMIRTLTTFIGVTKNNNIGKNSFYEKYILTDEKKKIYDYFYK